MKFAIKHVWSSLRDLATQSPILLALIAIFSCTPLYIEQDWFAEIDIKLYSLYFFIVILQSYITRIRKFSILYTLVSIGISVGLYMIHESYGYVRGIELATENISYLWLYSMIALYFTSPGEHYIGEIINRIKRIGITLVTSTLLREDTRFFYTYYPYVAIFYLFYLASFRSSESSRTQQILCFLFITLTTLCLVLIGKRVINEPVLWLNTIYVSAFNLIFLVHNVYSLLKGLKPSVHTTVMALALGTVLLTPFIGYTTYREFVYINFDAITAPKVISIAGYDKYIENIELIVYEQDLKEYQVESANFDSISFKFLNKGLDLEVSLPNGVTEVHHIYDKFLTVDKTAVDPVIIEGNGYKLLITSYFINQFDTRKLKFNVLYN